LPFRRAARIGSRAFPPVFTLSRRCRDQRPGGTAHQMRWCRYEAASARRWRPAQHVRERVPLRNTDLPTISATRFTNLNRGSPIGTVGPPRAADPT